MCVKRVSFMRTTYRLPLVDTHDLLRDYQVEKRRHEIICGVAVIKNKIIC